MTLYHRISGQVDTGTDWQILNLGEFIMYIIVFSKTQRPPLEIKNGSPSLVSVKIVLSSSFSNSLIPFTSFTTSTSSFQVFFSCGVSSSAVGLSTSSLESLCACIGK